VDRHKEILKKYWGFEEFRPVQENIINDILSEKDVFAMLPTGGGKSLCYQLPGIIRKRLTIVVSPLISLMQDQIKQLNDRNVKATAIFSGMSYREIDITLDNVRFGNYDFLYVSPERLQTKLFLERFKLMDVGLLVVDEAHCISQWGHDFRPSYKEIYKLRELKPMLPIAAFTATANESTKSDIITQLKLKNHVLHEASFSRKNLAYRIFRSNAKNSRMIEFCASLKNSCGIVYCQTRKSVKKVYQLLANEGISCAMYHGGLQGKERAAAMDSWMNESVKIMVATNAFGMGIDKANVRFVIHYEICDSIEAYFQEAGRAGRDQKNAIAISFVTDYDLAELKGLPKKKFPEPETISQVYTALCSLLNIAYGSGKDEVYPLDLKRLCTHKKLETIATYNALKLLELNGMLAFSEGVFNPARIKLNVDMSTLYNFQVQHESLRTITQYIIRKFPGVFDMYKRIELQGLAKTLKTTESQINRQLDQLQKYGVLDYIPASSLPTVTFLRERPPQDHFTLHPSIYSERKTKYEKQIQHIIELIDCTTCNAQYIITYFNQQSKKCGHCNPCIQNGFPMKNRNKILLDYCKEKTTVSWLMNSTGLSEDSINDFINHAQHEELIEINGLWIQQL
jgi:ATP-dependent DNA helicase RecQ